jgi:hypothetical protein
MDVSIDKSKISLLEVKVEFDDLAGNEELPKSAAFVLNRSGQLLAKKMLEVEKTKPTIGIAEFDLDIPHENVIVKIGPDTEDLLELNQYQTGINKARITPGKKAALHFKIHKPIWNCWKKVPYIVTGSVEKQENSQKTPLCFGEVDIYDIDIVPCFRRLPNLVVERLRDCIIDILKNPPPLELKEIPLQYYDDDDWCGTGPRPPVPPKDEAILKRLESLPNEWAFSRERFLQLPKARAQMDSVLGKMPLTERHAFLNREAVEGVKITQILYSNTAQFRDLLANKFQAFRFWLCWYPWIYWLWWPHCYRLNKLGTATINHDGSFNIKVGISKCRRDIPDLWFVVRQKINGVERYFVRHPVPCNTYWNHPSGKQIQLIVTDPNAYACHEDPGTDLDPADLWVVPLAIGNYSLSRINGTGGVGGKIGEYVSLSTGLGGSLQTFEKGPFGGMLGLRILFSPAFVKDPSKKKYYRIKYRKNGSGNWLPLDHEVVRHYSQYNEATKSLDFIAYSLGPKTIGSEDVLFEIPPIEPPKAIDSNSTWVVIDATVDLMNGYFDSRSGPTTLTNGKVEFKLEIFDENGLRINPDKSIFKLPSKDDVWSKMSTVDPSLVNPGLVIADPENQSFNTFVFSLQIDNREPTAIIEEPQANGNKTESECGILRYKDTKDTMTISYKAQHPLKYAMYQFKLYRGITLPHTVEGRVGGPNDTFELSTALNLNPKLLVSDLLGIKCDMAAFSENLYIWNMAFNGWNLVGPDASAVRAFAIAPEKP